MADVCKGLFHRQKPIFSDSSPGRSGASIPALDVPPVTTEDHWPASMRRQNPPMLPEVSEAEVVRHYTRLSQWNFCIDSGMYPLGSCTMKHNPKFADQAASHPAFETLHPYQPENQLQGILEILYGVERMLNSLGGFSRVSLQPAAGAQGELCGLMMIRAYLESRGERRTKVLVPDSAHGTNPASCSLNGYTAIEIQTSDSGYLLPETVAAALDDDVAAIMITNPNTLGLFEPHIAEITERVHTAGGLVYMDGANFNAIMGRFRPGDIGVDAMHFNLHKTFATPHGGGGPGAGPVGVSKRLVPFLPIPTIEERSGRYILDDARPQTIGRLRSFIGNVGVLIRAYVYIRELGAAGLRAATDGAVLNANYLRKRLQNTLYMPYPDHCMHEVIASDKDLKPLGITTMQLAKRLIDYGFHPPTVYFPLIVPGAMMIEPTESEPVEELDRFVHAMTTIVTEAHRDPDTLIAAPHHTPIRRLDEAKAARRPVLRYHKPSSG